MATRDLVVIGASAGGVEALQVVVADLPADLPAAVCIVHHVAPTTPSVLPKILANAGRLPASAPRNREVLKPGHMYVAPPDRHVVVSDGVLDLSRAARENGFRPSVDVLFRSAAQARGAGVIGVILTGALDDGTAGLLEIKRRGGYTIVQDPSTAAYPSMPLSAQEVVKPDRIVRVENIAAAIAAVAGTVVENGRDKVEAGVNDLTPAPAVCPECGGTMAEVSDGEVIQFRCHAGHAFSPETLLVGQAESVERALWGALRALEESAAVSRRLAERAQAAHHESRARSYLQRQVAAEQHAAMLRALLSRTAS